MKKQIYVLENADSFEPEHVFECGQCFRWRKQEDNSYLGIFKNNIMNVKKEDNKIIFTGYCEDDIEKVCRDYFDLETDYSKIKKKLSEIDSNLKKAIKYGYGIRIIKQDLFEMIISYIISANNNIPRIQGIIERMSKKYGTKVEIVDKEYYLFPTIEQLKDVSVQDFRNLGTGFRDVRLYETVQMIYNNEINLDEIKNEPTDIVKEKLMTLSGVGPKVADCILLFGLHRIEVFPIDVWVRRVMNDLYIHNEDENKVNKKQLNIMAHEMFGDLAGLAQQYLYYYKREE